MTEETQLSPARELANAIKQTAESARPDHVVELAVLPMRHLIAEAVVLIEADYGGVIPTEYDYIVLRGAASGHTILVSFTSDLFDARKNSAQSALADLTSGGDTFDDEDEGPTLVEEGELPIVPRSASYDALVASAAALDLDDDDDEDDADEDADDDAEEDEEDDWSDEDEEEEERVSLDSISLRVPIAAHVSVDMADLEQLVAERLVNEFDLEADVTIRGFDFTETTKIVDGEALFTAMIELGGVSPAEMNGRSVIRLKRVLSLPFSDE